MRKLNFLIFFFLLFACDEIFDYSPYEAGVESYYKNTEQENIQALTERDTVRRKVFKFAVIADSHYRYHELDEAIKKINSIDSVDFVIANGDITNNGYLKEFELFHNQMQGLKTPYLTVIGNHDYKSNGEKIYKQIYGKRNYTVNYNNCLFVFFDDVIWESSKSPDFEWLEKQIKNENQCERIFVVCHQPPFKSQFTDDTENYYKDLMAYNNVDLSIHGHTHHFYFGKYYNDQIDYLVSEAVANREFSLVTVSKDFVRVEQIKY